jgi:hypothetical protein
LVSSVTWTQYIAAFSPGSQRAGNLIITDAREEYNEQRQRFARFSVVHINPEGTDASDLADRAEEAAVRCGFDLPRDLNVIIEARPIRFNARPHEGSPREATKKRRVQPVNEAHGTVGV